MAEPGVLFLLAVTMVNVQNAANYFTNTVKMDSLSAQRLIAQQLIFNKHLRTGMTQTRCKKRWSIEHSLVLVPVFKKNIQG